MGTPNLEKTRGRLKAQNFEPGEPAEQPWGTTFVVRDPDGRRIEVIQRLCEGDEEFEAELLQRLDTADSEEGIPAEEFFKNLRERKVTPGGADRWVND